MEFSRGTQNPKKETVTGQAGGPRLDPLGFFAAYGLVQAAARILHQLPVAKAHRLRDQVLPEATQMESEGSGRASGSGSLFSGLIPGNKFLSLGVNTETTTKHYKR